MVLTGGYDLKQERIEEKYLLPHPKYYVTRTGWWWLASKHNGSAKCKNKLITINIKLIK